MFETHCHLDRYGDELPGVLTRAREAGVCAMVAIGSDGDLSSARHAVALASTEPDVWAVVGMHPHDASAWSEERELALRAMARAPRVVAWGETGLDYHYDYSPRDVQQAVFRRQIALAVEHDLPLVIHNRESDADCMEILASAGAERVGGVVHCFTSSWELARLALDLGFHIGFTGVVTFRNAENVREVLRRTPRDRIVIETDSPFLAPVPHRGKRNEPAYLGGVAAGVAETLGLPVEEVVALTSANARRLYRLPEA